MRVIVTRPAAQALPFVERLRQRGVDALALPLIGIEPPSDPAAVQRAWRELTGVALAMFVSANAVEQFFALRPADCTWPAGLRAGSTGPGTSAALRSAGIGAAAIDEPAEGGPYDTEALWQQLSFDCLVGTDEAMRFLVDTEGAARVMLGSNFAGWDQEDDIVRRVSGLGLDAVRLEAVLGGTATRWFGLPVGG